MMELPQQMVVMSIILQEHTLLGIGELNGGTTSTNDNGSLQQSTVQANTTAGFSIVKVTSPVVAHGQLDTDLEATPDFIIQKYLDQIQDGQYGIMFLHQVNI